jgi:hypothetical protein
MTQNKPHFEPGSAEDLWDSKCFYYIEGLLGDDGIDRFHSYLNDAWERDMRRYEKRRRIKSNRWAAVIGFPIGITAALIIGAVFGV